MMATPVSGLFFSQPGWLWGLVLPLLIGGWLYWQRRRSEARLARYADPHLLPRLILEGDKRSMVPGWFLLWSLLWLLAMLAMAGPRFGYTDVPRYRPGVSLLILLDLSRSMAATDVAPSRLARAQQEIADLLSVNPGFRVGLVAFASVPHVVAPITEDEETLRYLLPSLSPDLMALPGSRLEPALERAEGLFAAEPQRATKALVVISDGDFAEADLAGPVARLRAAGVRIAALGVGTSTGARVPGAVTGQWVRGSDGELVVSRLAEARLQALAAQGGGIYRRADFRRADTQALIGALAAQGGQHSATAQGHRVWHERYYLPLGMMLGIWVYAYVRGR